MRDFAANEYKAISTLAFPDPKDRLARSKALRDLFAIWDGCRCAIRIYKGAGNPKPVLAANDPSRRKRKRSANTPPPPELDNNTDKPVSP